jgi:hypothetical protein
VGRTPWSARVPLDPLPALEINVFDVRDRPDEGVGPLRTRIREKNFVAFGAIAGRRRTAKLQRDCATPRYIRS